MQRSRVLVSVFALLSLSAFAAEQKGGQKPKIMIIATGGTIAGGATGQTSYGYKSGQFKVEDLINAVPGLAELADVKGEQVMNIGSQDMNDEAWLKLANRLNQQVKDKSIDGVVITHGTDTMEETAYFLDLVVKTDKPVVMVGSMRPATAVSADGPGNLYNAVSVAGDPGAKGRGVLVVLNDSIHAARNVTKTDTTNVETFKSLNRGPQGLLNAGKIRWFDRTSGKRGAASEFTVDANTKLPKVDILYAHANMDPGLIDAAVADGAQGLVIAGVGDGNMTKECLDKLAEVAKKGVVVVRSSRVAEGVVLRNNEVDDDKLGFVASGELNPAKSRVLLQLGLMRTKEPKKLQTFFEQY